MGDLDNAKTEIIEFVRKEFFDDEDEAMEVDETSPLISSGIVDSFSMVSLKTFLEKKYSVQIPDAKATPDAFDTVENILELLAELKG